MIKSHTVVIQSRTKTRGTEGELTFTYATAKTIIADVQPARLTEAEAEMWGVTDLSSQVKRMFYERDTSIIALMRAVVDGETYEVRGSNHWPNHSVFLLVPVQGI